MRAQLITRFGVLGGLLAGLACAGNSARPGDTTVAADTTTTQNPPAYKAAPRDTTLSGVTDSAKSNQTKSGASEIKPGESTVTTDSTQMQMPAEQSQVPAEQSQPIPAKVDTLRAGSDTTPK